MAKLPHSFYNGDTVEIARALLGKYILRRYEGKLLALRITETEAYVGRMDKACHAYGYRKSSRNEVMFGGPGHAYIYLIYGMHCCLNFVTEPEGEPSAVLIRGGEAVFGAETMGKLRYGVTPEQFTSYQKKNFLNGPGKLCKALALTREQNGADLTGDTLWVADDLGELGLKFPEESRVIRTGKRIGIDYAEEAVHFPWRFYYE
ncbi:MAG: DNA-3-methyladenine glycosylase [Oscillospiraceae bacterium]|nr:DNA-3-methyladenine glycosylase [Oscillospiraceae bacterium]